MCQFHIVAISVFYCGSVGCWVVAVADMVICWDDVGFCSSGVGNGMCM